MIDQVSIQILCDDEWLHIMKFIPQKRVLTSIHLVSKQCHRVAMYRMSYDLFLSSFKEWKMFVSKDRPYANNILNLAICETSSCRAPKKRILNRKRSFPLIMENLKSLLLYGLSSDRMYRIIDSIIDERRERLESSPQKLAKITISDGIINSGVLIRLLCIGSLTSLVIESELGREVTRFDEISKIVSLNELHISKSSLTDYEVRKFESLSNLTLLSLDENSLTGDGFDGLFSLQNLTDLSLSYNPISESGADKISRIASLVRLSLSDCPLNEACLTSLSHLRKLKELDLSQCNLDSRCMLPLSSMTSLVKLILSQNEIRDEGLLHLNRLVNLTCLDLSNCSITDRGLENISSLLNLEELDLSYNDLTDSGVYYLKSLHHLRVVYLQENSIEDDAFHSLDKFLDLIHIGR